MKDKIAKLADNYFTQFLFYFYTFMFIYVFYKTLHYLILIDINSVGGFIVFTNFLFVLILSILFFAIYNTNLMISSIKNPT